jgi:apolipoprotein N-acyltransferase
MPALRRTLRQMPDARPAWRDAALLALTLALLVFANGRWAVALFAWLAPALLVRFVRTRPFGRAFGGGLLVLSVASYVWWRDVFPLSGAAFVVAAVVLGCVTLVPFLIDRRLAPRLGGIASTLVLPAAAVTLDLLHSLYSPFGSWGSWAYSQAGNLPLLQLVSVTGLAGITFLLLWLAAVVNRPTRGAVILYASVAAAAFAFGALRLLSPGATETVRIAAITPRIPTYTVRGDAANAAIHGALSSVRRGRALPAPDWEAFRVRAAAVNGELLAATEREARNGAKLVVWSEGAGIVERHDEATLLARGAEVARRAGVWIELSYLVLDRAGSRTFANQNVLLDASGQTMWTYQKAHPVPGMEACVPGDGRVPVAPTPFGSVATVICYDADFPRLVAQAGADILLIPADDWREIAPLHARMARFRAVEQGFAVVRATSSGFSTVVDRYGRVRASQDYFAGARTLSAEVPHRASPTPYARTGDVAAFVAPLLLACCFAAAAGGSESAHAAVVHGDRAAA